MTTQFPHLRARFPTMVALIGAGVLVAMLLFAGSAQAAPPNNNFANATQFGAVPGTVIGTNVGATRQSGEPDNGSATVWWKWTATETGRYHVDTCKTIPGFTSVVGVYTGTSVSQLVQRANSLVDGGSFDCADGYGAMTYFDAVAGTTYYISVGSYYSSATSQNIRLSLRRTPLNDNFSAARPFGKVHGTVIGRNGEATRQNGEPENGAATVWWRWTARPIARRRSRKCRRTTPRFSEPSRRSTACARNTR
jgi:hypothetical protein